VFFLFLFLKNRHLVQNEVVKGGGRELAKRCDCWAPSPERKGESSRTSQAFSCDTSNNLPRHNCLIASLRYLHRTRSEWWNLPFRKKRPIRKSLSSSQIQVLEQLLPSLSEEKRLIIQSILHDFGS